MKKFFTHLLCLSLLICNACTDENFLKDDSYRAQVVSDFAQKQASLPHGDLFRNPERKMNTAEQEALMFLYAYMPIGDMTDYSSDFYLNNIRRTLLTRQEMPWGKLIPDDLFRHFVLPVRINNENLDLAREIFHQELKDRVKDLPLYEAVLEVNHWCHEKMIYEPSDSRTSSPLASVRTASGRCGEESTFLVAALRSVSIPARQVYTPRWAHTDDNHAWVEAWVDGKWYFLGACEPEPVLNLGWFNAPASRGMLMHTKVFGRYNGPEEVMSQTDNYTEINIIGNYAPTTRATVTVTDDQGATVTDAKVEFKLYNYAEFYTVAAKQSDREGKTSLTAGKGDLLVWASKNGRFGFAKLALATDSSLTIVLNKTEGETYSLPIDIAPPKERTQTVGVTPEQREENDRRLHHEDSIRNAYTATFPNRTSAAETAKRLNLDSATVTPLLVAARGNYNEIAGFLESTPAGKREWAVKLLQAVSAKDLRDTPAEILSDHLNHSVRIKENERFYSCVLNPRIANELITPYRSFLKKNMPVELVTSFLENPRQLAEWCKKEIKTDNRLNSQFIPVSPAGVWKARVADTQSRNIFFVAVARTLGIPAWIDEVTGKIQYQNINGSDPGQIYDVDLEASAPMQAPAGSLTARYSPTRFLDNPKYYSHFTLSKYDNGTFRLLNYEEGDADMGQGANWKGLLKNKTSLDTGYYLLVTGTRMASGDVLANATLFNIETDRNTEVDLVMRENKDLVQVIGSMNSEARFTAADGKKQTLLQTTGRGYFIVAVLGANQEPTNHALRDISSLKQSFENWGRRLVFLFPTEQQQKAFRPQEFPDLPGNITYGIDNDGEIQQMITRNMKLTGGQNLPIFIIADTFNRVVFVSQGYTIGLGEQLMKVIHGL